MSLKRQLDVVAIHINAVRLSALHMIRRSRSIEYQAAAASSA